MSSVVEGAHANIMTIWDFLSPADLSNTYWYAIHTPPREIPNVADRLPAILDHEHTAMSDDELVSLREKLRTPKN